ncbi:putative DNA mismatch repair protein Mlh1 [Myxozyma melibiosi]|uniref:DNA mismatch repair protein Mlh1 n=1 Tax=Myxozyma melibiosi TaxID=54550 RepID=A0ABR1FBU7_9ASCO
MTDLDTNSNDPAKSSLGPKIKALDINVINRIAAGEIIVHPANALKEMLENSIDAGSTAIDIVVKDGGLKLLQITDNGHGINRDDLAILCERFTTSKLTAFEDLSSLTTYGFRGEALASISHIAHLTVTTRSTESECAWRAVYHDGKLIAPKGGSSAEPKATAGKKGTQILVEDLFFNVPSRLRAFRSPSDEYNRIVDVVGRYAVHTEGVAFTCKKHGESHHSIITAASASIVDRIRVIYGSEIASELIEINVAPAKNIGLLGARGWITNANFNAKKNVAPLFFINHRSISCAPLKRALSSLYSSFLPKGGHAFMYVSLLIEADKLDVNVHPTKREVRFLNEEEIIQRICDEVRKTLGAVDSSRLFKTQMLLQGASGPLESSIEVSQRSKRTYEYNMVRTDAKERKITAMLQPRIKSRSSTTLEDINTVESLQPTSDLTPPDDSRPPDGMPQPLNMPKTVIDRERVMIRLSSIKQLREAVREDLHKGLTELFANHIYVGLVDETKRLVAVQNDIKLFLVDYGAICFELFYQIGLSDFGNFGVIKLRAPISVRSLLEAASSCSTVETRPLDVEVMADKLVTMRAMLLEYFSVEITESGDLTSIPLLLKDYTPPISKLPMFIYRICTNVDWSNELECFQSLLRELAIFNVPESLPKVNELDESENTTGIKDSLELRRQELSQTLEHRIFPTVGRRLIATKSLLSAVIEIANLPGLYRIFERC